MTEAATRVFLKIRVTKSRQNPEKNPCEGIHFY